MRNILLLSLFILSIFLVMGASGCYLMSEPPKNFVNNLSNDSHQNVITEPYPSSGEVIIKDFAFIPSEITIAKGGKISFINQDSIKHTITSYSAPSSFSNEIRPGVSLTQFFNISGTYYYHCVFHPDMKGTVIVQ